MISSLIFGMTVLSLTACKKAKNEYPAYATESFMNSCQSNPNTTKEVCACVLDLLRDKYSFEEYTELQEKAKSEQIPHDFFFFLGDAKGKCVRQ